MRKSKTKIRAFETASEFEALPDAEKERIFQEIEREDPKDRLARSTPLNARDRERQRKFLSKGGRPKLGKDGVKVISLSVEKALLKRADAYAKRNGLKRSEFFSEALRGMLSRNNV